MPVGRNQTLISTFLISHEVQLALFFFSPREKVEAAIRRMRANCEDQKHSLLKCACGA